MATPARNRRRAPPPRDSRADLLYETKQLYTDYFAQLRRGYAGSYDANARAGIIDNIVHPKHGRWRGLEDPYKSARPPVVSRPRAFYAPAIPQTVGALGPRAKAKLQDAYSTTFRLNRNFTPAHVSFRKILGYGGFGVAALFGLNDSTGKTNTVVVKADLRPGTISGVKNEKKHMILMSGAQHVVQRTLLIAFPWPKDIPVRMDQLRAVQRFIIKLPLFLVTVFALFLFTLIQIIVLAGAWVVDLMLGEWEVQVIYDDASDAASDQDPQPAASPSGSSESSASLPRFSISGSAQPGPARPGASRPAAAQPARAQPARAQPAAAQPAAAEPDPAEPDPQQGFLPALKYWNMKSLWPKWPKAPPRALGIDGSIRQNRIELDRREDIISMEYLKFGDLGKWIGKMSEQNNYDSDSEFSERVAWIIFECLWRGCVALSYPTGFYQGQDPMDTQIPQMTESIEESAVGPDDPLVHFDLDPQNIFVGDFASDHPLWPLTKIGDLGLSQQPTRQVYADEIEEEDKRWLGRRRGKRDSLLPEQHTEEWDYIPDLNALRDHQVASNYGSHSNIYHIGLTMFELMTLNLPDEPPFARPYNFRIDRQSLSGWTYGHNLLSDYNSGYNDQFSAELRNTVAWCMEHNPAERPGLNRLGQIIERNAGIHFESESDTKRSVGNLLGTPLPPRVGKVIPYGQAKIFK